MSTHTDRRTAVAAVVAALLCLLLTAIRANPPAPKEPVADGSFSAVSAWEVLDRLYASGVTHPVGTENNRLLKEQILDHLREIGYEPTVQRSFVCRQSRACGHVENILARLEGTGPGKAVLLADHYDSVGAGPSVSDDGVAVAVSLEVARILKSDPPLKNDVIFLIDDGEEAAFLGAIAFSAEHPWAQDVGAVVNLEARGTAGRSYMFETGADNAWLIELMKENVQRPATGSVFYSIYKMLPRDTDFTIFKEYGMNGVNFAFLERLAHYHTPLDNLAHVTPATFQHQGDNALAMVRALADADLDSPPAGTASWFDVWGFGIVSWPETWNLPLAVASVLLVLVALGIEWQRRRVSMSQTFRGVVLFPTAVLGATALSLVAVWLLLSIGRLPDFPASEWAPNAAFWFIGLSAPALVISLLGRGAGARATWLATLLWLSLLSLLPALMLPGATYLFLGPALVGGTLSIVVASFKAPWLAPLAATVTVVAACAAQLIIAWSLWEAMGISIMPVVTFLVAVITTMVLATLAEAPGKAMLKLPLLGLAIAAMLLAASLVLPPFSEESPRQLSFEFVQNADASRARMTVRPGRRPLPEPIANAVAWQEELTSRYPWHQGPPSRKYVEVDTLPVSPPAIEDLEQEETEGGRRIRARLHSPRGADQGTLVFHSPERIDSLRLDGWELDLQDERPLQHFDERRRIVWLATMPTEGITVELEIRGSEPMQLTVVDHSFGLPPAGDVLVRARSTEVVPSFRGDLTSIHRRVEL